MTSPLALRQCLTANKETRQTRRSFSIPAGIMLHTRRQEPIVMRRSSVRRSRERRGGYQACVHALACKGLRLRTNHLPQKRGFNDPARNGPALLWLRSCMPSHPRLVRMPHRFSTNGNNSRLPSSDHVRLSYNPALPRCPRMRHSPYGTRWDPSRPPRLQQREVGGPRARGSMIEGFMSGLYLSAKPQALS